MGNKMSNKIGDPWNDHTIYFNAITNFYNSIPNDYERKSEISVIIGEIREKLVRSSPEVLKRSYIESIKTLVPYLPEDKLGWNNEAWNKLVDVVKEATS